MVYVNKTPGLYFEIQVIFGLLTLLTAFFSANTEVQEVNKNNLLQILLPTLYCYMTRRQPERSYQVIQTVYWANFLLSLTS